MKKLLFFGLFIVGLFTSCEVKTTNKFALADPVQVGWDQGKPVYEEFVKIQPTYSQVVSYVYKTGHLTSTILGVLLFLMIPLMYVLSSKLTDKQRDFLPMITFLLLAGSGSLIFGRPLMAHGNNEKTINKAVFDKAVKEEKVAALWDSMFYNNLIIGAAQKK